MDRNETIMKLKLAWNRHSNKFLTDWYRSGFLHPFYNPQCRFVQEFLLGFIANKNTKINFYFENKVFGNFIDVYWDNIKWIHAKAPYLHDLCREIYRLLGAVRWQRIKRKTIKKISILDGGCGSGNYYDIFKSCGLHYFLDYTGIDIADKNINNCRKFYPEAEFFMRDLSTVNFSNGAFDVVMVNQVFEHLPPEMLKSAVNNAYRIAKELLIINFFCEKDIPNHVIIPKDGLYYWNCLSRKKIKEILQVPDSKITITDSYQSYKLKNILYVGKYPVSYSTWIIKK